MLRRTLIYTNVKLTG